ncbi:sensor histidine kinase [Actinocorallia populi]|uniref:sensor histidine kinase n=1 Tax=Actinocorallia populi TaxID=2079200 RepID=UPI000D08C419|nr:HAMP domain-containing sensor histidine kinase [Actinocorallia populi]
MSSDASELRRVWKRLLKSVRGRATMVTLGVSAVVLGISLALALFLIRNTAQNETETAAAHAARQVSAMVFTRRAPEPIGVRSGETNLVQIVGQDGKVLGSTAALRGRPPLSSARPHEREVRVDTTACPSYLDECVHIAGFLVPRSAYGQPVMVYGAVPLPEALTDRMLPFQLGSLTLFLLLLIGAGTWFTIGLSFAPVEAIRRELSEITTTTDLKRRVPVPGTGGEIDELASTVNDTLHRLEEATERQRRFVSDASHDLRNPITGLQTRLEMLVEEPDDFHWKPEARKALQDAERLGEIVSDLLELARLDAGTPQRLERIDLADLATLECERRVGRVPVDVTSVRGAEVLGNRVRLSRALGNLLANAERHAASRVEVRICTDPDRHEAVVEVVDDGPGIPPAARERVFERFARLDDARELDKGGTGLGLPIARSIAEGHGGSLTLADNDPGARFVIRLPLMDPRSGATASGSRNGAPAHREDPA